MIYHFELFVMWSVFSIIAAVDIYLALKLFTDLVTHWVVESDAKPSEIPINAFVLLVSLGLGALVPGMTLTFPTLSATTAILTADNTLVRIPKGGIDALLPKGERVRLTIKYDCSLGASDGRTENEHVYVKVITGIYPTFVITDQDLFYKHYGSKTTRACDEARYIQTKMVLEGRHILPHDGSVHTTEETTDALTSQVIAAINTAFAGHGIMAQP